MGLLIFWVMICVIVMIHEFGHLIVAKKIGVKVNTFSIGFGIRLIGVKCYKGQWSFKLFNRKSTNEEIWSKDVTEYRISPIPFGGYCALEGEIISTGKKDELASKSFIKKCCVAFAGIFLNIGTGAVVLFSIFIYKLGLIEGINKTFFFLTILWQTFLTIFDGNFSITHASDVNMIMSNLSLEYIAIYFGIFSIFMAIVNALPFPALDGSLPVLWICEKIFGKKGNKVLQLIWGLGFIVLMILQVIVFYFWICG